LPLQRIAEIASGEDKVISRKIRERGALDENAVIVTTSDGEVNAVRRVEEAAKSPRRGAGSFKFFGGPSYVRRSTT